MITAIPIEIKEAKLETTSVARVAMMTLRKNIFLVIVGTFLQIQRCESVKYCQKAADSVKTVQSCPTSKTEWDDAARRKNCSRIASTQRCSAVDQFVYHCVINGYRNATLEVCAPTRIIFGHCVEFNVAGGVIQDQFSARCNESFPKCDSHYLSSTAYKYPDCYRLVQGKDIYQSTTLRITTNDTSATIDLRKTELFPLYVLIIIVIIIVVSFVGLYIRRRRQTETSNNTGEKTKLLSRNNDIKEDLSTETTKTHLKRSRSCIISLKKTNKRKLRRSFSVIHENDLEKTRDEYVVTGLLAEITGRAHGNKENSFYIGNSKLQR